MRTNEYPSVEELSRLFQYDPKSGHLRWRDRPSIRPSCNARYAGTIAGTVRSRGYVIVNIGGRFYAVHRVIWKMVYGTDPNEIDHIDGNPSNNSIINLREANRFQNTQNTKVHKDNASGLKGVSFHAQSKRWRARISIFGKDKSLGLFATAELAASAYAAAAAANFGEFARAA